MKLLVLTTIENPFASFWMAGFECTDQLNTFGERVDFLHTTSHLQLIYEDYTRITHYNLRVVREGVRWSQSEPVPYHYDFAVVRQMIEAGRRKGVQQVWDLCHFGFPVDLTPLHPHFTKRFAAFCRAFALFFRDCNPGQPLIVTPVNEVGFISWLGGEVAGTSPYCRHNGWEVKYAYMKAYIAGIQELKNVDPLVRILTTEPLVNVVADIFASGAEKANAAEQNEHQFQVLDMLCGRICPELGGREEYLDMIGFNYYYNNQWVPNPYQVIGWNDMPADYRYLDLSEMLCNAHKRYNRPIVLSETSHPGVDRPLWIEHIGNEVIKLLNNGIPFWGICLYPIVDRPDWDHLEHWHQSGLWDRMGNLADEQRVIYQPYEAALQRVQQRVGVALAGNASHKNYQVI